MNDKAVADKGFSEFFDEPRVDLGLAATVKLLSSQGALERLSKEDKIEEKLELERHQILQKAKLESIESVSLAGGGSRWQDASTDNRRQRLERQRVEAIEEKFRQYKPKVHLSYKDEFGREMTPKEAFKQQCYGFHGQKPGKKKQEKRLRKIEEELKRKAAASNDTPSHLASSFNRHMEVAGTAHVVLSVGNRPATFNEIVPSSVEELKEHEGFLKQNSLEPINIQKDEGAVVPKDFREPKTNEGERLRPRIAFGLGSNLNNKRKPASTIHNEFEPPVKRLGNLSS